MPFRLGPTELILILVVVMIIFGVGRLPQVGSVMGKAIREFRRAQNPEDEDPDTAESTERESETKTKA